MDDCIFCRIAQRKAVGKILYSDDLCLAILDINPVSDGHTLVISRNHYENVSDADTDVLQRMILVCRQIGEKAKTALGATGYNILNASGKDAQQSVPHLHFHVVPRHENDGLNLWFTGNNADESKINELLAKLQIS